MLPPILLAGRRRLLDAWERRHRPERIRQLEREHLAQNQGLAGDEICIRNGITLKIHPESRYAFDYFCFVSPPMVDELDGFLRRASGKFRLLDVGALHGIFALAFTSGSEARSAVAVDASPYAFAKLLYNIHKNPVCRVTPVECALTDKPGVLPMAYEGQHAVASSLDPRNKPAVGITANTGDALCEELGFAPDVIKIDVEGHEVKVLQGLAGVLARHRPLIFLELHPQRIRMENETLLPVIELLERHRYRALLPDSSPCELKSLSQFDDDIRLVLTGD